MPEIRLTIKPSLDTLAGKFDQIKVTDFLRDKIRELAFLVERESKLVTPVRTGRLRASISVLPMTSALQAIIQPHTEYAIYVHEGTRYMTARPFMWWGAKEAVGGFEERVATDLEKFIQDRIK